MIPIQQHGKRWLILTLTLSTSVLALASIGASQPVVFADENLHLQSQKNTNKIEVLDWEAFSKKLKDYSSDQRFNVFKLGLENRVGTLSTWKELEEFGKNHDFLVINGKGTQNIHESPHILVMNKGDILVNSPEEYKQKVQELQFRGDQANLNNTITNYAAQRIHALFPIHVESTKRQLLDAAGLKTADNHARVLNDNLTIYSHGYSVDNKFFNEYSHFGFGRDARVSDIVNKMNVTKNLFAANDDTILKMIQESKASIQPTDSEKVKTFVLSMANKVHYDWEAANTTGINKAGLSYYFASDLFAVTQRKLATCVGFSTTAARAFNFMGFPAYVVTGVNAKGDAHATTRVFYDGKWHTIDATGVRGIGQKTVYSDQHFNDIGKDSYQEVDSKELEKLPLGQNNYMVINKEYEEWAMRQKTADLLLFNKEKSLVGLDHIAYVEPKYVSQENKKHLLDIYKVLQEKIEEAKKKDLNLDHKNGYEYILKSVVSDIDKLNKSVNITEKEFAEIKNSMKNNKGFLSQLDKEAAANFEDGDDYKTYLAIMEGKKLQEDPAIIKDNHNVSENQLSPLKEENQANSDEVTQNSKDASAPSVNSAQQSEELLERNSSTQETISVTPSQQTPAPKVPQAKTELEDKTETSSLGNTEMVSPSSETAQNTVDSKEENDDKLPHVEVASKESSEAQVNTVSSPQVISASPTSPETNSAEVVTESSVVESDSASPTSPETNSTEAVTTSQEMAESSVSAPQVSSEIQTSSETTPTDVATEVTEPSVVESDSASPTSPETNSTEAVTTSQEMAGTSVSAPQVSSEIQTSSETAPADEVTESSVVENDSASQPSSETISTEVATEVTESSVVESNSASQPSPETTPTETVTASQEVAESPVSAPQTSSASLALEVPKNERLDKEVAVTVSNGVEANTHEAGSVPTSDIHVQDAGSATVIQPRSVLGEAISTVEPVGVATSPQERSAVASEVKVPASLERSNNSIEEEKVVDSNATIENREPEKKEVFTSENVLNSLVTIWVALSTSFFMRYFSRGK
ncbi:MULTISPECIES: transglutaminase domain-containing protein [Streptococcus]|uniref:transglutaminase domain-containing protein n=1 Tax=Streptococcus TaxID=1301 RepID=UPI000CF622CD|nr:transglutaminase domain-containing protein [Streptococcus suis]MBM7313496.1 transglutaminase [Streptococcus suis]MBM7319333.1 transglutaminase [Streptococcus suis]MBY4964988.1 transglutaminase [Streptococcus suis]TII07981.1 transglutaminase [Streptococcus suis]